MEMLNPAPPVLEEAIGKDRKAIFAAGLIVFAQKVRCFCICSYWTPEGLI